MRRVLPIIVIAQFFCTSLWFAGNSIVTDITRELQLGQQFLAHLTSAIQLGFIAGTLVFAVLTIADRFSPSAVFFISSLLAGLFNLGICIENIGSTEVLLFRFLTGFFLAGIYPVGMKITADYFQSGLGKSLGFLVGALVLGTAFPHLLKDFVTGFPWKYVLYATTGLSFTGGLLILIGVPNGPYRKPAPTIRLTNFLQGFKNPGFRSAAFGYFGHMWELYTFWAFVPIILTAYNNRYPLAELPVSLFSFLIIASGSLSCVSGGILSQYFGVKKIAALALTISCCCCLLSPFFLFIKPSFLFLGFLFVWGIAVIADSPLFSTLVSQNAPGSSKGSAITIVNCIGFSITIVSIQFINLLVDKISPQYIYMLLAIGPVLGLAALFSSHKSERLKQ